MNLYLTVSYININEICFSQLTKQLCKTTLAIVFVDIFVAF